MTIIADVKEPPKLKYAFDGVDYFKWGDYHIEGSGRISVVERKTMTDFVDSLRTGRLNRQIPNVHILLVERGKVPKQLNVKKMYDQINTVNTKIPVWWCNEDDTILNLRHIEDLLLKDELGVLRVPHVIFEDKDDRVRVLQALKNGIGLVLAESLIRTYGSISNAFDNINNWPKDIKSIGQITMNRVKRLLCKEGELIK